MICTHRVEVTKEARLNKNEELFDKKDMGSPIKVLCIDRGGKYISQEFENFCENHSGGNSLQHTHLNKMEFVNGRITQFLIWCTVFW